MIVVDGERESGISLHSNSRYSPRRRSIMMRFSVLPVLTMLVLWQLPAGKAYAAQVYRWVDGEGNTYFSDVPPKRDTHGVTTIEMVPFGAASGADDHFSVVNQLQRMQQRRLAVQRERREVRAETRDREYERRFGWRSWYYQPYFAPRRWGSANAGYWHPYGHRFSQRPGHRLRPQPLPTRPSHVLGSEQHRISTQ